MSANQRIATVLAAFCTACACSTPDKMSPTATSSKNLVKVKSSSGYKFLFPKGVDWSNATPTQIADAVFAAAKHDPNSTPEIAASGLTEATKSGRFPQNTNIDGKHQIEAEPNFWSFRWLFPRKNP